MSQGRSKVKEYAKSRKKSLCITFKSLSNIRIHNDILTEQVSRNKLKYWILFSTLKLTLIWKNRENVTFTLKSFCFIC